MFLPSHPPKNWSLTGAGAFFPDPRKPRQMLEAVRYTTFTDQLQEPGAWCRRERGLRSALWRPPRLWACNGWREFLDGCVGGWVGGWTRGRASVVNERRATSFCVFALGCQGSSGRKPSSTSREKLWRGAAMKASLLKAVDSFGHCFCGESGPPSRSCDQRILQQRPNRARRLIIQS